MGKKLESNFTNMVVVLFAISLIASAGVGYVYTLTQEPIAKAAQAKQQQAISNVVPGEFDNDPTADMWTKEIDGGVLEFYPAKKGGELVGTAVKTFSNNGFNGYIEIMAGFKPDGSIYDYSVLKNNEGEIDAITAATISSRAFLDAINRAAAALQGSDATSGATQQNQ